MVGAWPSFAGPGLSGLAGVAPTARRDLLVLPAILLEAEGEVAAETRRASLTPTGMLKRVAGDGRGDANLPDTGASGGMSEANGEKVFAGVAEPEVRALTSLNSIVNAVDLAAGARRNLEDALAEGPNLVPTLTMEIEGPLVTGVQVGGGWWRGMR